MLSLQNYCSLIQKDCSVSLKKIEHEHPYRARRLLKENFFENFIQDINVEDKKYHALDVLGVLQGYSMR